MTKCLIGLVYSICGYLRSYASALAFFIVQRDLLVGDRTPPESTIGSSGHQGFHLTPRGIVTLSVRQTRSKGARPVER